VSSIDRPISDWRSSDLLDPIARDPKSPQGYRAVVDRTLRAPIEGINPGVGHTASPLAKVGWSQEFEPDAKTKATLLKIPGEDFGEMALRPARELIQLQA
jgi:hypothetical protein